VWTPYYCGVYGVPASPPTSQNTTSDGAVGAPVYAYSRAADVAVTFLVVGGNDTVPMFKINFCSGQLRLIQSGLSALASPYVTSAHWAPPVLSHSVLRCTLRVVCSAAEACWGGFLGFFWGGQSAVPVLCTSLKCQP
jgi:hypothetical protein